MEIFRRHKLVPLVIFVLAVLCITPPVWCADSTVLKGIANRLGKSLGSVKQTNDRFNDHQAELVRINNILNQQRNQITNINNSVVGLRNNSDFTKRQLDTLRLVADETYKGIHGS